MKILRQRIKSFRTAENISIDFTKFSGITGIDGANGTGKSSCWMDAPTWALFDKPVQKTEYVHDVCSERTGVADVELDIQLPSGREITISRFRRGSQHRLTITGITDGTPEGKQDLLERMLGFDYDLWTRTVAFGGTMSAFCSMTDAQKKEALEKLLGLEQYAKARERAADLAKQSRENLSAIEGKVSDAQEQLSEAKERLQKVKEQAESYQDRYEAELKQTQAVVRKMQEELLELQEKQTKLAERLENEAAEYRKELAAWERKREKQNKIIADIQEKNKLVFSEHAVNESEYNTAKKEYRKSKEKDHPEECPTCNQKWPKELGYEAHTQALKNKLEECEEKFLKSQAKAERCERELREAKGRYEAMNADRPEETELDEEHGEVVDAINSIEKRLAEKKGLLKSLKERSQENPYKDQVQHYQDQVATYEATLQTSDKKLAAAQKNVALYEFWVKGFGRQGIPSYLIDNSIPFLNETVQRMASILTDGQINIHFDPTVEGGRGSKGGQQLGVVVKNRYGGGKYVLQSKGEKARVDVCVLLAIRQLMAQRLTYGFEQLFIDEIFDGMDHFGIERVVGLLRSEFPSTSIFVITHNDSLKGMFDQNVQMTKKKGVSHLRIGG